MQHLDPLRRSSSSESQVDSGRGGSSPSETARSVNQIGKNLANPNALQSPEERSGWFSWIPKFWPWGGSNSSETAAASDPAAALEKPAEVVKDRGSDILSVSGDEKDKFFVAALADPLPQTDLHVPPAVLPVVEESPSKPCQTEKTDEVGKGFFGGLASTFAGGAKWAAERAAGGAGWVAHKVVDGAGILLTAGVEEAPKVYIAAKTAVKDGAAWVQHNYPNETAHALDYAQQGLERAARVGAKVAENVVFWSFKPEEMKKENADALRSITGNDSLHDALAAIAPKIAELIQKHAIDEKLSDGVLKKVLKGENTFIVQLLETMLPRLVVNIDFHRRAHSHEGKGSNDPFVDDFTHVISVVNRHFERIHPQIQAIEAEKTGAEGKAKALQLFAPLAEELLSMALPNGEKDLPVISLLQGYLYAFVKESFLPDQLYDFYHEFMDPQMLQKNEAFKKVPGGEKLANLCTAVSEALSGGLPKIIVAQREMLADKIGDEIFSGPAPQTKELKAWLRDRLANLGASRHAELQKLWKFAGNCVDPIMTHVLLNLAQAAKNDVSQPAAKEAIYDIASKLLTAISSFVVENEKEINAKLEELERDERKPDEDPEFVAMFRPLADRLLDMIGLEKEKNLPAANVVKAIAYPILRQQLPKLMAEFYRDIMNPQAKRGEYQKRLRDLLFDPGLVNDGEFNAKVAHQLANLSKGGNDLAAPSYQQVAWEQSGAEEAARQIEHLCGFLAGSITEVVRKYLNSRASPLSAKDSQAQQAWGGYAQKVFETLLLKVIVNYAESTPDQIKGGELPHPKALLPANMIVRFAGALGTGFTQAKAKVEEAQKIRDPALRQKKLRKAMLPLARQILQMASPRGIYPPLQDLPIPGLVKEKAWKEVEKKLLPDLLADIYQNTTLWENNVAACRAKLFEYYQTTHAKEACRVISHWVSDFIPNYLAVSNEDVSGLVYDVLKKHLSESGVTDARAIDHYLKDHGDEVKKLIAENLRVLGGSKNPAIADAWPAAKDFVEAALLKVFTGISGRIHSKESQGGEHYEPEFLVHAGLRLLKVTADHFRKINEVKNDVQAGPAHNVSYEQMVAGFGEALHGGVPHSPEAIAAMERVAAAKKVVKDNLKIIEKGRSAKKVREARAKVKAAKAEIKSAQSILNDIRKKNFFIPFANELLKLANIKDPQKLPFPSPLREEIWEIIKNNLVPEVLMQLYQLLLDPNTINLIMLSSLDAINETMESIAAEDKANDGKPPAKEEAPPADDLQRRINLACGELVLEMVEMMPHTLTRSAFRIEGVRTMAAEKVGQALRNQLGQKWTMLKIIDKGIEAGLPKFRDGAWEGAPGQETFVAKRITADAMGHKKVFSEPLKFTFPRTAEEIEKEEIKKLNEAAAIEKKLKKTLVKTISTQVKGLMKKPFSDLWNKFQGIVDNAIEKHLGGKGMDVKRFCDKVCHAVFFTGVGTVLKVIGYPVDKAVWFLIELYIGSKAKDIIKNVHMGIHENLFYRASDALVDVLGTDHTEEETLSFIEEVIHDAEIHRRWNEQLAAGSRFSETNIRNSGSFLAETMIEDTIRYGEVYKSYIGPLTPLKEAAAQHGNGVMRTGLERLDREYVMRPIKGDGHCMFRAIAAGLLMNIQERGPASLERLYAHMRRVAEEVGARVPLAADMVRFKTIAEEMFAGHSPMTVDDIIKHQEMSDELVRILRRFTVEYNKVKAGQTMAEEAAAEGVSLEKYFADMQDMRSGKVGGEPELIALAKFLDLDIRTLNVRAIGQGHAPDSPHLRAQNTVDSPKLWLIYRPSGSDATSHYDLGIKK